MIVNLIDIHGTPVQVDMQYGCSFGCGNMAEIVMTTIADSTTQFLCIPCHVQVSVAMVQAMTDPDDPEVVAATEAYGREQTEPTGTRGRGVKRENAGNSNTLEEDDGPVYEYGTTEKE